MSISTALLKARLALELPPINAALDRALDTLPGAVQQVARSTFEAGGKRLRPLLTRLCARLLGCTRPDTHDLAITLEMLHTATLLHDDVLDNAPTRRGHACAHTVHGTTPAILAGDALLAQANAIVASFGNPALSACFSEAIVRTCTGEIEEIFAAGSLTTSEDAYTDIIRGKTAWLIRTACVMGGIHAGADAAQVDALATYGEQVGLAFQMVDDALDFAPEAVTGKPTGGDLAEGKLTPPIRLYRQTLAPEALDDFDSKFTTHAFSQGECEQIAAAICAAGFDQQTREQANACLTQALTALETLPDRPERDILRQMADYVRDRKK